LIVMRPDMPEYEAYSKKNKKPKKKPKKKP